MNDKKTIEWDNFPGMLENPSDFRKGSGDYGVTLAVAVKHVDYIKPLMEKAQKPFAVFVVPCVSLEQAEELIKRQKDSGPELQGLPSPHSELRTPNCLIPVEAMAEVLGVDPRTVQLDAEKGLLVRTSRGQYDTLASCGTLRRALKEAETGKNDAYNEERTQAIKLKRMERELGYYERAGKLGNVETIQHVIEKAKAAEKQQVLFMPKQLAPMLEGDPAVNEAVLEEWAHQFLKGQTELNIMADITTAPAPDVDKMPEMKKRKKRKKRR